MEITRNSLLQLINAGMKQKSLNMTSLEREARVPKDTIRDFLRGKTQILRADKFEKIMRVLQPSNKVVISGLLGKEGEVLHLPPDSPPDEVDVPPGLDPADVVAIRVRGDSMTPVFYDGWVIYYSRRPDLNIPVLRGGWQVPYNKKGKKPSGKVGASESGDPLAEFYGKPCVVKLDEKGGKKTVSRTLVGTVKRGSKAGLYAITRFNARDVKDAQIEWAAKIIFIKTE